MALASFVIINSRWRPALLRHCEYDDYAQLRRFMPKELFESRMQNIKQLVSTDFPHVWLDTYLFVLAMVLVILAAIFAVVAVELSIETWYPLCILVVPAIIACWTARRRGLYFIKLSKFYEKLDECLKNMTVLDTSHRLKWDYRSPRDIERSFDFSTAAAKSRKNDAVILIIEITRINNAIDRRSSTHRQRDEEEEGLPMYNTISQDLILDIGPPSMEEHERSMLSLPPPVYRSHVTLASSRGSLQHYLQQQQH
ncbi:hypothetical protein BDB00DRAFT_894004 [Zychaea mexicana]|uniref:uncharacterized protein n=1 Tax=Zychaea mexicana TaxID=64656 RepID=UPI0022FDDE34|nr:uncharacterized protein BDB00DRAFT_894004 [Zychaea mexicana]KAI9484403.1 hypothetical protein BDB00DRAFT_894004 [Zychaea mexicana]